MYPVGMNDQIGKLLLAALLIGFGLLAWRAWQIRQASPTWPSTEGEILVSRAYPLNESHDGAGTPTRQWMVDVTYRYTVQGRTYTGDRLRAFIPPLSDEATARALIAGFPVGARVRVYHDPDRPDRSVLIPG